MNMWDIQFHSSFFRAIDHCYRHLGYAANFALAGLVLNSAPQKKCEVNKMRVASDVLGPCFLRGWKDASFGSQVPLIELP